MFTQIMVPLDGTELAEQALPCGQRLAEAMGATLHLVRVVEPPPPPARLYVPIVAFESFMHEEIEKAEDYLAGVRDRLAPSGVPVRAIHLVGETPIALRRYRQQAAIDLVVMSSHGRDGASRVIHGSLAADLVKQGDTAVLLVRPFGESADLGRVILPLDGSPRAEAVLSVLQGLAGRVVREVTLLRVIEAGAAGPEAEKYLAGVRQRLEPLGVPCTVKVVLGDAADQIIALAGSKALVLMATHGRSGIVRWALGSVADRVARGGVAAVLLVHGTVTGVGPTTSEKNPGTATEAQLITRPAWALGTRLRLPFVAALDATRVALKEEGLHILVELDLTQAMSEHMARALGPTVILSVYNPVVVGHVLQDDPGSALLLWHSVMVYANDERTSTVEALDPECRSAIAEEHHDLAGMTHDSRVRLQRAIDRLAAVPSTDLHG
jgi:nucleotide-binding universal stress UspA family protein/uncharacterized protein (DUF302 family)